MKFYTRGETSPNNKQKILISGNKADVDSNIVFLKDALLSLGDVAVFAMEDEDKDAGQLSAKLQEFQVVMTIVSPAFLAHPDFALEVHNLARENHICCWPVINMSQIPSGTDTAELFRQIDLVLDKTECMQFGKEADRQKVFFEKLQANMDRILLNAEETNAIEKEFRQRIFLSYRKKDIETARTLIERIHKNEQFFDVSIWYDTFLTPGENYDEEIRQTIETCDLFVVDFTPNFLEINEDGRLNYAAGKEYPWAKDSDRPILPVEMVATDYQAASNLLEDLPAFVSGDNEAELAQFIDLLLKENAKSKEEDGTKDTQEDAYLHCYRIGLAYLEGVKVEVNHSLARKLITYAADRGDLTQAKEKLADMYFYGHGVERNVELTIRYLTQLYESCIRQYKALPPFANPKIRYELGLQAIHYLTYLFEVVYEQSSIAISGNAVDAAIDMADHFSEVFSEDEDAVCKSVRLANCVADRLHERCLYDEAAKYYEPFYYKLLECYRRSHGKLTEYTWNKLVDSWYYNDTFLGLESLSKAEEVNEHALKYFMRCMDNEDLDGIVSYTELWECMAKSRMLRGIIHSKRKDEGNLMVASNVFMDAQREYSYLYELTHYNKYFYNLAEASYMAADCLVQIGRTEQAAQSIAKARNYLGRLPKNEQKNRMLEAKIKLVQGRIAMLYGKNADAENTFMEAIDLCLEVLRSGRNIPCERLLAEVTDDVAYLYYYLSKRDAALLAYCREYCRKALSVWTRIYEATGKAEDREKMEFERQKLMDLG